jgi:hypothetical protein
MRNADFGMRIEKKIGKWEVGRQRTENRRQKAEDRLGLANVRSSWTLNEFKTAEQRGSQRSIKNAIGKIQNPRS